METTDQKIADVIRKMEQNRKEGRIYRVLFLDFDGVVNVPYEYGTPEFDAAMAQGVYDFFRPEIVVRLNALIHDYDLHVVISSSWRFSGMQFCQDSLRNAGFSDDIVIEGMTALDDLFRNRWEEILEYLEQHPEISEFLILDDIPMRELSAYAVQTVFEEGYSENADEKARRILRRQIDTSMPSQRQKLWILIGLGVLAVIAVVMMLSRR